MLSLPCNILLCELVKNLVKVKDGPMMVTLHELIRKTTPGCFTFLINEQLHQACLPMRLMAVSRVRKGRQTMHSSRTQGSRPVQLAAQPIASMDVSA